MNSSGNPLATLAIYLVVVLVIFLVCREIVCWYWKVNKGIALLTEIRDLLAQGSATGQAVPVSPADDAQGSLGAAKNLAASGHTAEQISKELQKWRGLAPAEADALARSVVSRP